MIAFAVAKVSYPLEGGGDAETREEDIPDAIESPPVARRPPSVGRAEVEPIDLAERGSFKCIDDEVGQFPAPCETARLGPGPVGASFPGPGRRRPSGSTSRSQWPL